MEKATELATWARDSGLGFLSLLGGEPFLHPELPRLVKLFRQTAPATSLQILTGGVYKKRLINDLSPEDLGIIFNVNEPGDYRNPKHYSRVIANIETAIARGFRVILGFNVWRMDFDPGFMPQLADSLGRSGFRWTVANPQWNTSSGVIEPDNFQALAPRIMSMLEEAARLNQEATLDCPLPLCFFSQAQLAWVRQYHPATAARMGYCSPVLDVTPELEAIRCFALSTLARVKVTDFPNEWSILNFFQENLDSQLLGRGCFDACAECAHFIAGRCSGGCFAWHKLDGSEKKGNDFKTLALNMQRSIEAGDPQKAINLFENSEHRLKKDIPTYMAALAAIKAGKSDQAFRYAARAIDITFDPNIKQKSLEILSGLPDGPRMSPVPGQSNIETPLVVLPDKNT